MTDVERAWLRNSLKHHINRMQLEAAKIGARFSPGTRFYVPSMTLADLHSQCAKLYEQELERLNCPSGCLEDSIGEEPEYDLCNRCNGNGCSWCLGQGEVER